jgi:hypothetical protein
MYEVDCQHHDVSIFVNNSFAAMPSTGGRVLRTAIQAGKAKLFCDGFHPESGRASRLELVGTIDCPRQTRKSLSWSIDGKYLATCTNESVSVWRLPRISRLKYQCLTNKTIDAGMIEEAEMPKVKTNGPRV